MADYKLDKFYNVVSLSIETNIVTLADLQEVKLLAFRLGIPQTAKVTIEAGKVTFVYKVENKLKGSKEDYPDQVPKKPWDRKYPNEF